MSITIFTLAGILILLLAAAAFDRQLKQLDKTIRSTHENTTQD